METVYLSRRNLMALLSKLDRKAAGEETMCMVIKNQQPVSDAYRQTMPSITVVAVEDDEYYSAQNRPAGAMIDADESKLNTPITGVAYPFAREKWGYGLGNAEGEWADVKGDI